MRTLLLPILIDDSLETENYGIYPSHLDKLPSHQQKESNVISFILINLKFQGKISEVMRGWFISRNYSFSLNFIIKCYNLSGKFIKIIFSETFLRCPSFPWYPKHRRIAHKMLLNENFIFCNICFSWFNEILHETDMGCNRLPCSDKKKRSNTSFGQCYCQKDSWAWPQ